MFVVGMVSNFNNFAMKKDIDNKQDKLVAGANISISSDNVISASGEISLEPMSTNEIDNIMK